MTIRAVICLPAVLMIVGCGGDPIGSNDAYSISMTISGFTGPGSYALNSGVARHMSVMALHGSGRNWGGSNATSSGSVVLTNVTTARV